MRKELYARVPRCCIHPRCLPGIVLRRLFFKRNLNGLDCASGGVPGCLFRETGLGTLRGVHAHHCAAGVWRSVSAVVGRTDLESGAASSNGPALT